MKAATGIRPRLLGALHEHTELTVAELADLLPDIGKAKVGSNVSQMRIDNLVSSRRDDITGKVSYKLTHEGLARLTDPSPTTGRRTTKIKSLAVDFHAQAPRAEQQKRPTTADEPDYGVEAHLDGTLIIWHGDKIIELQGHAAQRVIQFIAALNTRVAT